MPPKRKHGLDGATEYSAGGQSGGPGLTSPDSRTRRKAAKRSGGNEAFHTQCLGLYQQFLKVHNQQAVPELTKDSDNVRDHFTALEYMRLNKQMRDLYVPVVGKVFVCGSNDTFQMGNSNQKAGADNDGSNDDEYTETEQAEPTVLLGLRASCVSAGSLSSAVVADGMAYTWGASDNGVLGRRQPPNVSDEKYQVNHTRVTGFVRSKYAFHTVSSSLPIPEDKSVVQVATNGTHLLIVTLSGAVYMSGGYRSDGDFFRDMPPKDHPDDDILRNNDGPMPPAPAGFRDTPRHVWQMPGPVRFVACGGWFSAAILFDGTIYTWGLDVAGELGRKVTKEERESLVSRVDHPDGKGYDKVFNNDLLNNRLLKPLPPIWAGMSPSIKMKVLHVACGESFLILAARRHGNGESAVYGTGLNQYGQLGLGDKKNRDELTLSKNSQGKNIVQVAAGQFHSLWLNLEGTQIYACGRKDSGQVGTSDDYKSGDEQLTPAPVPIPDDDLNVEFASIACGECQSYAVTKDGNIYSWGFGESGALGHKKTNDENYMRKISTYRTNIPQNGNETRTESGKVECFAVAASGGSQHACFLMSSSTDKQTSFGTPTKT